MILSRISPTVSMSALILRILHVVSTNKHPGGAAVEPAGGGEEEEDQTGDVTKGEKEGTLEQGIHNIPSAEC